MVSVLPSPEPADPEEGKPGHFAHSNWLKASVKALDGSLTQVDARVNTKSPLGHGHDDLYYTETEINNLLAGKSPTSHLHDERYYTESEIISLLSGKSDTSHGHAGLDAGVRGDINELLTFRGLFRAGSVAVPVAANATSGAADASFSAPLSVAPRVICQPTGTTSWAAFTSAITASGFRLTIRNISTPPTSATTIYVHYIALAGVG